MSHMLERIVADKVLEIAQARQRTPLDELERRVRDLEPPRNFFSALTRPKDELRVIAEVKRASPSAGVIREDFDPVAIAATYRDNGAAAISCLTDARYFQGSLADLSAIKQAVGLPVLRKDFILDLYQVYESRVAGADAILLIAECIPQDSQLLDLLILATELKMTTLLEVYEVENLLRVRPHVGFPHPRYTLLGINNRNLKTMTTDLNHTLRLVDMVENREILVSESGIRSHEDCKRLMNAGIHRVLVGEHLLRQPDVGAALRKLMEGDG